MEELSKVEETVLIAVLQLENNAYGYRIRIFIRNEFKKEFSIGNLYSVLNQLDRKGYVEKIVGESALGRRGKPKIIYSVTKEGMKALKFARKAYNLVWKGLTVKAFDIGEKKFQ